jgi:hypothetical protein
MSTDVPRILDQKPVFIVNVFNGIGVLVAAQHDIVRDGYSGATHVGGQPTKSTDCAFFVIARP